MKGTFSKEYWQLAMTRQNWKTQMSLKKPWSSSRNPKKATRLASTTANTFSPTRRFLDTENRNRYFDNLTMMFLPHCFSVIVILDFSGRKL